MKSLEPEPWRRDPLTLVGSGPALVGFGLLAARADWPLVGITSSDHRRALESTLLLGCPAFPDLREPVAGSRLVLLETADGQILNQLAPVLRPGTVVGHFGPEGPDALPGLDLPLALHLLGDLPLLEFASLAGRVVALEGPEEATRRGASLVRVLGGSPRILGRLHCLLALAAVELARRRRWEVAVRLWPGPAANLPAALPALALEDGDPGLPSGGAGALPCEAPLAVLAHLLRDLDLPAARLCEEEERRL